MTQMEYDFRKKEIIAKVNKAVEQLRMEMKLNLEKLEVERQKDAVIDK